MSSKKTSFSILIMFLFTWVFLSSCNDSTVFKGEKDFEDQAWTYDDIINFNVEIADTNQLYDIYFDMEYEKSYPYQNLYFKFSHTDPQGQSSVDTLNIDLIDRSGHWIGECDKDKCEISGMIGNAYKINTPGNHQFSFEQFNRNDSLRGIDNIGILILFHLTED